MMDHAGEDLAHSGLAKKTIQAHADQPEHRGCDGIGTSEGVGVDYDGGRWSRHGRHPTHSDGVARVTPFLLILTVEAEVDNQPLFAHKPRRNSERCRVDGIERRSG